jgi:hypothetical protein
MTSTPQTPNPDSALSVTNGQTSGTLPRTIGNAATATGLDQNPIKKNASNRRTSHGLFVRNALHHHFPFSRFLWLLRMG